MAAALPSAGGTYFRTAAWPGSASAASPSSDPSETSSGEMLVNEQADGDADEVSEEQETVKKYVPPPGPAASAKE